jgi:hypothetical protein
MGVWVFPRYGKVLAGFSTVWKNILAPRSQGLARSSGKRWQRDYQRHYFLASRAGFCDKSGSSDMNHVWTDLVLSFLRFKRAFLACAGSCSDRNPPDF